MLAVVGAVGVVAVLAVVDGLAVVGVVAVLAVVGVVDVVGVVGGNGAPRAAGVGWGAGAEAWLVTAVAIAIPQTAPRPRRGECPNVAARACPRRRVKLGRMRAGVRARDRGCL
jgi:hypothetical protein